MRAVPATTPAVVRATVHHRRTRPFDYSFAHRTTTWLVDAAAPNAAFPRRLRPFLDIRGEDHLGPGDARLIDKLRAYLRAQDLDWSADTVRVLVNARTGGYVFDPLTTYFCFDGDGTLEGIVAEVHNTYGERHCYALPAEPPAGGVDPAPGRAPALAAVTDKTFYVSPFFAVEGRYDVRARLTDDDVAVAITLTQDGEVVFAGSVHGALTPATPAAVARALLRSPFASQRVAALIRWHGIRLWLRRLPVLPRPPHHAPEGLR